MIRNFFAILSLLLSTVFSAAIEGNVFCFTELSDISSVRFLFENDCSAKKGTLTQYAYVIDGSNYCVSAHCSSCASNYAVVVDDCCIMEKKAKPLASFMCIDIIGSGIGISYSNLGNFDNNAFESCTDEPACCSESCQSSSSSEMEQSSSSSFDPNDYRNCYETLLLADEKKDEAVAQCSGTNDYRVSPKPSNPLQYRYCLEGSCSASSSSGSDSLSNPAICRMLPVQAWEEVSAARSDCFAKGWIDNYSVYEDVNFTDPSRRYCVSGGCHAPSSSSANTGNGPDARSCTYRDGRIKVNYNSFPTASNATSNCLNQTDCIHYCYLDVRKDTVTNYNDAYSTCDGAGGIFGAFPYSDGKKAYACLQYNRRELTHGTVIGSVNDCVRLNYSAYPDSTFDFDRLSNSMLDFCLVPPLPSSSSSSGEGDGSSSSSEPSSSSRDEPSYSSSGTVSNSSGSVGGSGYWCDDPANSGSDFCRNAGRDEHCERNPSDPYCSWSILCSRNPDNPACQNPQPPPGPSGGGPGGGIGGNSSSSGVPGDGGGLDSAGSGSGCKDLNNCDWAKHIVQLKELGVAEEQLNKLNELLQIVSSFVFGKEAQDNAMYDLLRLIESKLSPSDSAGSGSGSSDEAGVYGSVLDKILSALGLLGTDPSNYQSPSTLSGLWNRLYDLQYGGYSSLSAINQILGDVYGELRYNQTPYLKRIEDIYGYISPLYQNSIDIRGSSLRSESKLDSIVGAIKGLGNGNGNGSGSGNGSGNGDGTGSSWCDDYPDALLC